jgi:hypothetical protein
MASGDFSHVAAPRDLSDTGYCSIPISHPALASPATGKIRRAKKLISPAGSTRFHASSPAAKNIPLGVSGKSAASFRASRLVKGRIAIVTNVEAGSGGRETSQHSFSECGRTMLRGRPSRVVLAPQGWR